jgi:hypothetical protein
MAVLAPCLSQRIPALLEQAYREAYQSQQLNWETLACNEQLNRELSKMHKEKTDLWARNQQLESHNRVLIWQIQNLERQLIRLQLSSHIATPEKGGSE